MVHFRSHWMKKRAGVMLCVWLNVCYAAFAAGWNTNAWPTYSHLRLSNAVMTNLYALSHAIVVTNWTSPTSEVVWTDRFLTDIWPDAAPTNEQTNVFFYTVTAYSGTVAWTKTLTGVSVGVRSVTNLALQAQDVWALETYFALQERIHFVSGLGVSLSSNLTYSPKFYRSAQSNLSAAKTWLNDNARKFVLPATNPVIGTTFYTEATVSNLMTVCNLPTNYLAWTPNRGLSGSGFPYYRMQTCFWDVVASSAGVVTQTTWDCCGNSVVIEGTNGQRIATICTNADIQGNFTSLDYGYSGITAIVSKLVFVVNPMGVVGPGFMPTESWGSPTVGSWDAAKSSIAPQNIGFGNGQLGPGMWSIGIFHPGTSASYTAYYEWYTATSNKAYRWTTLSAQTNFSGVQVAVEMWGRAVAPFIAFPTHATSEVEIPAGLTVNGVAWSTNWQALSSTLFSNGEAIGVSDGLGTNTLPPWCSEPTEDASAIARGFYMNLMGLIRGDVTNGLRYR